MNFIIIFVKLNRDILNEEHSEVRSESKELKKIRVAICGNPNSGKTSIFNALTGSRQHVGNWPGVTVERKTGQFKSDGYQASVEDLPGAYSLSDNSPEELIARDYIVNERPDVLVNVVDGTSLTRSLYLYTQLIDFGLKLVIVLNMSDEMREKGILVKTSLLSKLLGATIVYTVGHKGEGIEELKKAIIAAYESPETEIKKPVIRYGKEVEDEVKRLIEIIAKYPALTSNGHPPQWIALKLLEGDKHIQNSIAERAPQAKELLEEAEASISYLETFISDPISNYIADRRFGFIKGALKETLKTKPLSRRELSEQIDAVLLHPLLGFPFLLIFLWIIFNATFTLGEYPMNWIDSAVLWLASTIKSILPDSFLAELITDGIIAGVGSVIVFLPNILILFFFISIMEDSGYMARIAFITDRIMHLIGLHGKSFIPMVMAFGCNVPAIMATRTLENRRDRLITILVNPLISCSARLPVFILIAGTFFPNNAGNVIFGLYLLGFLLALFAAFVLSKTVFRGTSAPFVMELPPYRLPTLKAVSLHSWFRGALFLKKMGTVILLGSVIVWALNSIYLEPAAHADESQATEESVKLRHDENTLLAIVGKAISPLFAPIGFDWKDSAALLSGFFAKEIVVSTYGVLYGVDPEEGDSLKDSLRKSGKSLAVALALMVFVLTYTPCLAALLAIRRESGSRGWMAFSVAYQAAFAWILAFLVKTAATAFI
ncbi:MAG: ferrous iron transport protein B [Myxococcota bacterium]